MNFEAFMDIVLVKSFNMFYDDSLCGATSLGDLIWFKGGIGKFKQAKNVFGSYFVIDLKLYEYMYIVRSRW